MTIARILHGKGGDVVTVGVEAPLSEVVRLLHDHRIGAVLAMEGTRIAGVVSERDIVRALHSHGAHVLDQAVATVMTSPVVTVSPQDGIVESLTLMTERRFRHLPVCEDGQLIGIVSIGDLVKRRIDDATREAALLKDYITAA